MAEAKGQADEGGGLMRYTMAQLWTTPEGDTFDCHFSHRTDDRDTPPVIRSYRNISRASVCRFFEVSGMYRVAYSQRPERRGAV